MAETEVSTIGREPIQHSNRDDFRVVPDDRFNNNGILLGGFSQEISIIVRAP